MSTEKWKVLGLFGLPLLAIAVAVMIFTIGSFSSPDSAYAADDIGQVATIDDTGGALPASVVDDCLAPCSVTINNNGADTTIDFTGDDEQVGLDPWTLEITYDDTILKASDISPAVIPDDVDVGAAISPAVLVDDNTDEIMGHDGALTPTDGNGVNLLLLMTVAILTLGVGSFAIMMTRNSWMPALSGITGLQRNFRVSDSSGRQGGRDGIIATLSHGTSAIGSSLTTMFSTATDQGAHTTRTAPTRTPTHPSHGTTKEPAKSDHHDTNSHTTHRADERDH